MTQPHPTLPDESEPPGGGAQESIVECFLKAPNSGPKTVFSHLASWGGDRRVATSRHGKWEWELSMAHPSSLPLGTLAVVFSVLFGVFRQCLTYLALSSE